MYFVEGLYSNGVISNSRSNELVKNKIRCKKHTELICIFKKLMKYRKCKSLVIDICYVFILVTRHYTVFFYLEFSSLKFFLSLRTFRHAWIRQIIIFLLRRSDTYNFECRERHYWKIFSVIICLYSQINQSEILFRSILNSKEFILPMIKSIVQKVTLKNRKISFLKR